MRMENCCSGFKPWQWLVLAPLNDLSPESAEQKIKCDKAFAMTVKQLAYGENKRRKNRCGLRSSYII